MTDTRGEATKAKSRRGFASMTAEQKSRISAMGGAAVPAEKRTYSKDRQLAVTAGRKGGQNGRTRKPDAQSDEVVSK